MCFGYDPEREERRLRNLYNRRSRWLARNWATSWEGNDTLTFTSKGTKVRVTIFAKRNAWHYVLILNDESIFSPETYEMSDEAKFAAFDDLAERLGW